MKGKIGNGYARMKTKALILPLLACLVLGSACAEKPGLEQRALVEQLIRDQLDSWSLEDEELFLSTVHSDIVFAYPGASLDEQGALELLRYWSENYSDTRVYVHKLIIDQDDFSVEYQFATTRDRDGARSASGTVATGSVQDGKLIVWKEYLDGRVSKMQMNGELPVNEGEEPFPWPREDSGSQ